MAQSIDLRPYLTRLQQLKKAFGASLNKSAHGSVNVSAIESYIKHYLSLVAELKTMFPEELEVVEVHIPQKVGYGDDLYLDADINRLLTDCEVIYDTLSAESSSPRTHSGFGDAIFITHGRDEQWRRLQPYLEKQLGLNTVELSQQAYRGRNTITKLDEESNSCCYAIIVMTGDDTAQEGQNMRARPNVLHEIGFFQAKFGIQRVCLMYEIGTEIPSNIEGLGRVQFKKGEIESSFAELHKELQEFFDV